MEGIKNFNEVINLIKEKIKEEKQLIKNSLILNINSKKWLEKFLKEIEKGKAFILNPEVKTQISKLSEQLSSELDNNRRKLNLLLQLEQKIRMIAVNTNEGLIFTLINNIEKYSKCIEYIQELYPELLDQFKDAKAKLIKESEYIFINYQYLLSDSLGKKGIKLDSYSNYPKLSVADGFIKIEINEKKRKAIIRDFEKKLCETLPDIDIVAGAIEREYKRLFDREFEGGKVLNNLWRSYEEFIKSQNLDQGESMPINMVIESFKQKEKQFRLDEFIIDLSRLAEKGPYEISGYRIDFQHTRDANKGIILQGAMSRGYIGYVLFRRIN